MSEDAGRIDADALKLTVDIVAVIGDRIALKRVGKDWRGVCPFHDDTHPSMDVVPHKQIFHCKACGASGDVLEFVMRYDKLDFKAAAAVLGAMPAPARLKAPAPAPKPVIVPPDGEHPQVTRHNGLWCYTTADGKPWFWISRHDTGDTKANGKPRKFFTPWTWTDDGWQKQALPPPRPLYKLHELTQSPGANVVLVEGEKCADAGTLLFPTGRIVTTWPGGAQAVSHADLEPLRGRKVFIWPDPDAAGTVCRDALIERLHDIALEVWVWNVSDCPSEFDLAEALTQGWTYERIKGWSTQTIQGVTRLKRHEYEAPVAAIAPPEPAPVAKQRAMEYTRADMEATGQDVTLKSYRHRFVTGGKDGMQIIKCMANCLVPFREDPEWRGVLRFDELRQVIRCTKPTPWGEQPEQWTGSHDVRATEWLDRMHLHYGAAQVGDALMRIAQENGYHPVREYLASLVWDGTPRLDSWLSDYCGVKDTRFTRFAGAKFMIAAVNRVREPGCFVKNVLVLQGPQDVGKSWVPKILGGQWYAEMLSLTNEMKAEEQCSKVWIIENSEMAGTSRVSDDTVKKFMSKQAETYRPAYAKHVVEIKRCCVFISTANPDELFGDATGNVRYWPVTVTKVDTNALRAIRDQLWAEAAHRQAQGETYWMDDAVDQDVKDQARAEQDERMRTDEWTLAIRDYLAKPEQRAKEFHRLLDVMKEALGLTTDRQPLDLQLRAASIMRQEGYHKRVRNNTKVWLRLEHERAQFEGPDGHEDAPPMFEDE